MKTTGIIRPVDKMGRVVIPKEIRNHLNVKNDIDSFEIFVEEDRIILKKYQPTCFFCESLAECVQFGDYLVCESCIEKLKALKEEQKINRGESI